MWMLLLAGLSLRLTRFAWPAPHHPHAVWLHCLSGRRVLALVPPTPRNLATYCAWAASARYAGVFLPAHCEGVLRVELGPGDTLVLPGGWVHAAATTSAAVLLGGCFLRRDVLALQLEAWRIEVG